MKLSDVLMAATERLAAAGVPSPDFDARALALHLLGLRRPSELLGVDEIDEPRYDELVALRAERVPLQHLVGSVGFRHLDLLVGPGVFIPRPETELVAGCVIDHLRAPGFGTGVGAGPVAVPVDGSPPDSRPAPLPPPGPAMWSHLGSGAPAERPRVTTLARAEGEPPVASGPVVVDLCSGSGAIALSIAQEVAAAVVHAVELDPAALEWAQRNDPTGTVTWHLGPVAGCLPDLDGRVDVVVSNPPYVPVGTEIDRETAEHDPALALWGGADGLEVIREVETTARRLLKPGGLVVVEHDVTHGTTAPEVFRDWAEVADHRDLTGRDRFVTARWPG